MFLWKSLQGIFVLVIETVEGKILLHTHLQCMLRYAQTYFHFALNGVSFTFQGMASSLKGNCFVIKAVNEREEDVLILNKEMSKKYLNL